MQIGQTWTTERIALLKNYVEAGLSCRQIANEIGVTRNAVIGKVSRLGLSALKGISAPLVPDAPRERRTKPRQPGRLSQRRQASAHRGAPLFPVSTIAVADMVIDKSLHCDLLALSDGKCRWPIGEPGKEGFCFCGGEQTAGLSYCAPHARLAYRGAARPNIFVPARM
jgi:GcrA cell cycle regulator